MPSVVLNPVLLITAVTIVLAATPNKVPLDLVTDLGGSLTTGKNISLTIFNRQTWTAACPTSGAVPLAVAIVEAVYPDGTPKPIITTDNNSGTNNTITAPSACSGDTTVTDAIRELCFRKSNCDIRADEKLFVGGKIVRCNTKRPLAITYQCAVPKPTGVTTKKPMWVLR